MSDIVPSCSDGRCATASVMAASIGRGSIGGDVFLAQRTAPRVSAGDAARELLHPWVGFRDLLVIAEVEHRRAPLRAILLVVVGAEHPIPEVVGDPEVAVLVEEVVLHVT